MAELFRPEVYEAQAQRLYGEISLGQPLPSNVLVGLVAAICVAAALTLSLGSYTRTETVPGMLITSKPSLKIIATNAGTISNLFIRDGDIVKAGAPLVTIDLDHRDVHGRAAQSDSVETIDRRLALADEKLLLTAEQVSKQRDRLRAAIVGAQQKIASLEKQQTLQAQIADSDKKLFEQVQSVEKNGFITRIEYEQRRQNALGAEQMLAVIQAQKASARTDLAQAKVDLAAVPLNRASSDNDTRTSIEALAAQRAQFRGDESIAITSPIDGRVTAVRAAVGRAARPDVPLLTIIPRHSQLVAELYAPSRAIGFIKPGQEVRLLYDAYAYDRYGSFKGRILSVSAAALDPRDIEAPLKLEGPVYIIRVALDSQSVAIEGKRIVLQPGMSLTGNMVLERDSFLGWLFAPLRAVTRRT